MSIINFPVFVDLPLSATPSSGYSVAYDLDGVLKQKDSSGIITPIGSTDQNLADVLSKGYDTGTYSILFGTNSYIGSLNGGGQILFDSGASSSVFITTDYGIGNESSILLGTISSDIVAQTLNIQGKPYLNLTGDSSLSLSSQLDISLETNDGANYQSGVFAILDSVKIGLVDGTTVYPNDDESIYILNTATQSRSTTGKNKWPVLISSRNSWFNSTVKNSAIIGGSGITASSDDTVYLGNSVNINNAYTLPSTDGPNGYVLKTDGSGNVSWGVDSAFQALSDVLSYGNNSQTYDIIMGTGTGLLSANSQNSIYLDSSFILSTDNGTLATPYIQLSTLGVTISSASFSVSVGSANITTSSLEGLVYSSDYSATFATNSIISKKYVDDLIKPLYSNRTAFVDSTYGSNATALINRFDRPYQTVAAATFGLTSSGSSGLVYIRRGQYTSTVYLQNNFDFYCEPGVLFTDGGFTDSAGTGMSSSVYGYAKFLGSAGSLRPLVVTNASTVYFEFDESKNTHSFAQIDSSNVTIKGNYISTRCDGGFGISTRGNSNINVNITKEILGSYKTISFSNSFSGTALINCPNINTNTDLGIYGYLPNNSISLFTDNNTSGTIQLNGKLSNNSSDNVYTLLNPDSIGRFDSSVAILGGTVTINGKIDGGYAKGLYVGGTVSTGQTKVVGDITARREAVVVNSNLVSAYLSEGTLKSFGSGSLPYVVNVVGTSSTVYVKDDVIWNTRNNSSLVYVFSTFSSVGLYDVLGYSSGTTGEFVYTTQSVNIGFHSVRSNKDNNALVTDLFGPSGFIWDTALFIPNF